MILLCTKLPKDTIFIVNKESTLNVLVHLLKKRAQLTQYMEETLKIVTINHNNEDDEIVERGLYQICFLT